MMTDLFDNPENDCQLLNISANACLLRRYALDSIDEILIALDQVLHLSPFRQMVTRGGYTMSVAMSNCGELGWVSDRRGYRYSTLDPLTGNPWPTMPPVFRALAHNAASRAGFPAFDPDACLINRYLPGTRLSLHQDKNEKDFSQPIVSVSLGMSAQFQFGGFERSDKTRRIPVGHGDVVVWGGEDRLRYHGILPLKDNPHPLLGSERINLTFRKAG